MNQVSTILIINALFFAFFSHAEGVGSSGGGSGIVLKTGEVVLADLATVRKIQVNQIATPEEIKAMFFTKNRYVKTIATYDKHFFDCAIAKIQIQGLSVQNEWIEGLKQVRVLRVQMQLAKGASPQVLESQAFPRAADSSSAFTLDQQVALASYSKEDLWIQARFVKALSEQGLCGLSVHEALRHLNNSIAFDHPLGTDQIETITREMMDGQVSATLADAMKMGSIAKLSSIGDLMKKFGKIYEDLKRVKNDMELLDLYSQAFLLQQLGTVISIGNAETRADTMSRLLDFGNKFGDYIMNNIDNFKQNLTQHQKDRVVQFMDEIEAQAEYFKTHNFSTPLDQLSSSGNYVDRIGMGAALTEKLPRSMRFDVLLNAIVK